MLLRCSVGSSSLRSLVLRTEKGSCELEGLGFEDEDTLLLGTFGRTFSGNLSSRDSSFKTHITPHRCTSAEK